MSGKSKAELRELIHDVALMLEASAQADNLTHSQRLKKKKLARLLLRHSERLQEEDSQTFRSSLLTRLDWLLWRAMLILSNWN